MTNCCGREAHQRAIARALRIRAARNGIACALEPNECLTRGISDIETGSRAGVLPASPPSAEPLHKIALIQVIAGKEGVGKAERHCRVIGPLARF
jgi:plasmid stability protein